MEIVFFLGGALITWFVARIYYVKTEESTRRSTDQLRRDILKANDELRSYTNNVQTAFQSLQSSVANVKDVIDCVPIEAQRLADYASQLPRKTDEVAHSFQEQVDKLSSTLRSEVAQLEKQAESIGQFAKTLNKIEENGVEILAKTNGKDKTPVYLMFAKDSMVQKVLYSVIGGTITTILKPFVDEVAEAVVRKLDSKRNW